MTVHLSKCPGTSGQVCKGVFVISPCLTVCCETAMKLEIMDKNNPTSRRNLGTDVTISIYNYPVWHIKRPDHLELVIQTSINLFTSKHRNYGKVWSTWTKAESHGNPWWQCLAHADLRDGEHAAGWQTPAYCVADANSLVAVWVQGSLTEIPQVNFVAIKSSQFACSTPSSRDYDVVCMWKA